MAVEYDPALINKVFEVTEPVEVKAEKIARYCAALGETNPIYTDEEAGEERSCTAESSRRRRSR